MHLCKKNIFTYLFLVIIGIYYSSTLIYLDGINTKPLVLVAIVPAILKIFTDKYTIKQILGIVVLLLSGLLIYIYSSESTVLIILCTILCMKNVDSRIAVKLFMYINIFAVISIVMLCALGFLQDNIVIMDARYRHSFGFAHPNILAMTILDIVLMKIFSIGIKNWKLDCSIIMIISLIVHYITDSRTVVALLSLLIMMIAYENISCFKTKDLGWVVKLLVLFGFFSLVLFIIFGDNPIVLKLDRLLNSRITLFRRFYDVYGIGLFGNNIWKEELFGYYVLDQGYANVAIRFGILGIFIVIISFFSLVKFASSYNKYIYCIAIIILLYGFSENVFTFLNRNLIWFVFSDSIYKFLSKKKISGKKELFR